MSDVPPASIDLECGNEEPSEATPVQFDLHSSFYNDFFLLRTKIAINGTPTEITFDSSGTTHIEHSEIGVDVPLSNLVPGIATTLSQKHGLYHIDTFYYEQVPLFAVVFDSKPVLRKFLENKEEVNSDLGEILQAQFKAQSETRPRTGELTAHQATPGQDEATQESQLQVSVDAELFLASPKRSGGNEEDFPELHKLTLATFEHFVDQWQRSKLFEFDSSMFSDEVLSKQPHKEAECVELKDLQRALKGVVRWFQLGIELDIPTEELLIIRRDNILFGVEQCLMEMLIRWGQREKTSWTKVVGALVNIGRRVLAEDVAKKYGVELPRTPPTVFDSETATASRETERELSDKEQELDQSKKAQDVLIGDLESDSVEVMNLHGQSESLSEEVKKLEYLLHHRNEELEYLQESEKKMKNIWKETVERMKKEAYEKLKGLQHKLTVKKDELELTKAQLKQKEKELEEKTAEVEEKSAQVRQLQEEVEKLKKSFSEQQEEMNQKQIESSASSLSHEKYLEEVMLQLDHAKNEVSTKEKEIELHNQNLATNEEKIRQLSLSIAEKENEMVKLREGQSSSEQLLSTEHEHKILYLSLRIAAIRLKEDLRNAEFDKWRSSSELRGAQQDLKKYKSMIPDITKCRAYLAQEKLEKHTVSHLRVCLFDEDGDPCTGSHKIETEMILLADSSVIADTVSKVVKDKPGEYIVGFTPTRAGPCVIQVTINDIPLPSGPLKLQVENHPDISKCQAYLTQEKLEKHATSQLRFCLFDEDGDPCTGSQKIQTEMTLLADSSVIAGSLSKVVKDKPGEYVVSFTPTRAGPCVIQVTVNDIPLHSGPLSVHVLTNPDFTKCYATGPGLTSAEKDQETECQVVLLDSDSDPCYLEHDIESQLTISRNILTAELVHCKSKATAVDCDIQQQKDHKYKITYQPTHRGKHELHIKINGKELRDSPYTIAVTSSPQSLGRPVRGTTLQNLSKPYFATTNSQSQILVTEYRSHQVSILSPQGMKIGSLGRRGSAEGEFNRPTGITRDEDGNIYVVDNYNHRIQKFTSDGKFIKSVGTNGSGELQFSYPYGVCFYPNNRRLYVCDTQNHRIQILTTDLTYLSTFGRVGTGNGEFNCPVGIAFSGNGHIYVTDIYNHRIQVLDEQGEFLRTFTNKGKGTTLQNPWGIAIDSNNTVYVSEQDRDCISVFSDGEYLTTFGSKGRAEGQFNYPSGLCIDKNDQLIVCDYGNGRIQIF